MKEFYKPTGRNGDSKESDTSLGDGTDSSGVVIPPQCQGCPYANYIINSSAEDTEDKTPGRSGLEFARAALRRSGHTNKFTERLGSTVDEILEGLNSTFDKKDENNGASAVLKAQNEIDKATKGCTGPLTTKIPAPGTGYIAEFELKMCNSPTLYGDESTDKPARADTHDDPEEARKQYISGLRGALQPVDDGEEDCSVTSRRLIKEIRDADDNKS